MTARWCWLVGMAGLVLSGFAGEGNSDMIRISAQIHSVNEDGSLTVIAEPKLAVSVGKWATFKDVKEYTFPVEYSLPSIPIELAETAKIARKTDGKEAWTTNRQGALLPEHPTKFESKEYGLTVKFRPRINSNGKLLVECDVKHTAFHGFIREGNPITITKKRKRGKDKSETLLDNMRLQLEYSTRRKEIQFLPTKAGHVAKILSDEVEGKENEAKAPKILVTLSATRLKGPEAKEERKATSKNARVYITIKTLETPDAPAFDGELGDKFRSGFPILSDAQFQMWIRSLNQKKGVDLLSTPSIMLKVGQTGKVEIVREFIYPVEYDPPEIPTDAASEGNTVKKGKGVSSLPITPSTPTEFRTENTGVEIDVTARILSDGRIELDLKPGVVDFEEFINFGTPIVTNDTSPFGRSREVVLTENRIEMPMFHIRNIETTARLADGSTVVLGGLMKEEIQDVEDKIPVLGDLPLIGRLARSKTELHLKRRLFFAITAKLVDSAGASVE